jgi:uncharacterized membrane protein YkvA (DUF1232 family)
MKRFGADNFKESQVIKKVKKVARSAGMIVIYPAIILYYLFKDKKVPISSKSIIAAALAYFIFPADSIPDITPIIGYSDDLSILLVSIAQFYKYITPEILSKTKDKLIGWFGEIQEIDKQENHLRKRLLTKSEEID